jgi:predicted adenylyl cyclase CyaB
MRAGRNIELKCRCGDLASVQRLALGLGAQEAALLRQRDTFFGAARARLKLRELGDGRAELISYRRPDRAETRGSDYLICPVADPDGLRAVLADALGVVGEVRKERRLLLLRHTRIHLDRVEGLGDFVELETVLEGIDDEAGQAELGEIAAALALRPEDRVPVPYLELLRQL